MQQIVERVARAINGIIEITPPLTTADLLTAKDEFERQARAAILETLRAVREPSQSVIDAGFNAQFTYREGDAPILSIYRAMIDQLIKEIESDDPS